jgi:uncharacterized protein (UPF0305 family)
VDLNKLTPLQLQAVRKPFTNDRRVHPAMTTYPGGYMVGVSLNR